MGNPDLVSSLPWMLERQFTSLAIDVKGTVLRSINFSFQSKPGFILYLPLHCPPAFLFCHSISFRKKIVRVVGEGYIFTQRISLVLIIPVPKIELTPGTLILLSEVLRALRKNQLRLISLVQGSFNSSNWAGSVCLNLPG